MTPKATMQARQKHQSAIVAKRKKRRTNIHSSILPPLRKVSDITMMLVLGWHFSAAFSWLSVVGIGHWTTMLNLPEGIARDEK
jgi:hypothetical protein